MTDESRLPDRGEDAQGYRPDVSSGVSPQFWRYHLHDTNWRTAYICLIALPVIGLLLAWLGWRLLDVSRIKTMLLGVALCGAGGLAVLLGPLIGFGGAWTARARAKVVRDGLLIPGVVVSTSPLVVAGLADLGKDDDQKGREFALGRVDLWSLPGVPKEVGARVPCVAEFSSPYQGRYLFFSPYPIPLANGDPAALARCFERLGEAPFRRLEALVAQNLTPDHWNHVIVVDADGQEIETRNIMAAEQLSKSEAGEAAGAATET